jgi:uncharacterized membrane protein YwzB
MTGSCLLPGFAVVGWYLGAVVLDVVRGSRVLDYLMLTTIVHVRDFVEECIVLAHAISTFIIRLLAAHLFLFNIIVIRE